MTEQAVPTADTIEVPLGRMLRASLFAVLLGLLGLGLNRLGLPLLGAHVPVLLPGGAPVLLAFVLFGPGFGLLCGVVAMSELLFPLAGGSLSPALYLVEAWAASWLYRRNQSLIFCVTLYWCAAGWPLALAAYGGALRLDRHALALLLVSQVLGGLMNAVVAEAVLLWTEWRSLNATAQRPPEDLQRFFVTRATLAVAAPTVVLALAATREISQPPRLQSGPLASLYGVLLLTLGLVFLLRATLAALTRRVASPLQAIARAAGDAELQSFADESFRQDLERSPIAEIRGLAARLAKMHETLSYHDPLTELPNRKLLLDRLGLAVAQALRTNEGFALLHVDLDRFRVIDNSLGRTLSNKVLKQIVGRLRECVRAGDTLARVGDDEFALLMPRMGQLDEAVKTAQRVMDSIKRAVVLGDRELFLTASVGISLCPRDGHDAETLLKNADAAMRLAKEGGQDTYRRYTARISAKDAKRMMIESTLRGALSRGEMVLHYQPRLDLASGRVEGMEALIRCPAPGATLMYPEEFIPVAEASDLVVEIGLWVLSTACAQTRAWQQKGYRLGVAVNLSARQFQQPDLVSQVMRTLEATGLDPRSIEIEITESVAIQDMARSVETLKSLRQHGISISMDDFGTGYSSLSHLKALPVDKLKLDKSFVGEISPDPNDAVIAVAVIALAHSLKLKVVAEGVETEEQLAFLRRHGCDAMQGYLFSRPVPAVEFETLLEQNRMLPPSGTA